MAAHPHRLSEAPEVVAVPLDALELEQTPPAVHFRRNHYAYPLIDPARYELPVSGAVARPLSLDLADLARLPRHERHVVLECAGHRRNELEPRVAGVQWEAGALSHARWQGPLLSDVLALASPDADALEVVLTGADRGAFEDVAGTHAFARSLPLSAPVLAEALLATELDGRPLPREHGAPLRAIVPGWYAVASVKWLVAIEVVTEPFSGVYQALDYRFQGAGDPPPGRALDVLPISSLVTSPADRASILAGASELRGIAWGGDRVATVDVRVDDDAWRAAAIRRAADPAAATHWSLTVELPPGLHRITVRATAESGGTQPERATWNVRGYANNSWHRIAVVAR